jgi:hypothetical protein
VSIALIAIAFVIAFLGTAFGNVHPATTGCFLPIVIGLGFAIYIGATEPSEAGNMYVLPFGLTWALFGAVPGMFVGYLIRERLKP